MRVWIEVDSKTQFEVGDIITQENYVVSSHDGDRGTFNKYREIILRPMDDRSEQNEDKNIDYFFVFKNGDTVEIYGYMDPQQNSFDSETIDITKISGAHAYVFKSAICYFEEIL